MSGDVDPTSEAGRAPQPKLVPVLDVGLTVDESGVARLETRTFRDLMWEAADDPDFGGTTCLGIEDGRVEQAVAAATCSELEVITAGDRVDLPPPNEMTGN